MVPLALAVMATTRKSSIPTQPWRLATSVVNLWVKSARRRACRARSLAISLMLRRSRFEYRPALCRFAQRSWRALRRSRLSRRRHSPAERVDDMRRGVDSSETNAEQATPKSTPHPGNPLATAGRSRVPTPKLTCQPRASRDTVALRIAPEGAGQAKSDPADLREPHLPPPVIQRTDRDGLPGQCNRQMSAALLEIRRSSRCCGFHQLS